MKFNYWNRLGLLLCILGFVVCLFLNWCWNSWDWSSDSSVSIYWFDLEYDKNINLEKVHLMTDDLDEIVDLYQEVWESSNSEYRDSLLIAEKYAQWLWANAFAQDNLDMLVDQWLTIEGIQKTQVWLHKYWDKVNAVLVEYTITEWLIDELPLLYVSQLFIPKDNDIILMSFVTENKSSHLSAVNMFKNIK